MSEDEQLPDNLSLLVEDILSHRFKRNLSIEQPPKEIVTSTPVMKGPRSKKLITPSKVFNYPKPKLQIDDLVERSHESKENLIPKKSSRGLSHSKSPRSWAILMAKEKVKAPVKAKTLASTVLVRLFLFH